MKKNPIGFTAQSEKKGESIEHALPCQEVPCPKKSVVHVYFPHRDMGWSYYNDKFDLKVGDLVYVEGKLEGYRGKVTQVSYSFKIKSSDYKKVVAVIDTSVKGDLFAAGSHFISFDKNVIPFQKTRSWFFSPIEYEEYIDISDDTASFPLEDLSFMKILRKEADRGLDHYMEKNVTCLELDNTHGRAIVDGTVPYEIEFEYSEGIISNIRCSCFEAGSSRHEYAVMLQLRETLDAIADNFEEKYDGYFAAISRDVFFGLVMGRKDIGKITLGV